MPGQFLVFQLATQVKWKIQVDQFDARWPFGLGDSLLIASQKTKTPSMQEGCDSVCLWTSVEATFFSYMESGWFPKRPREGGVENSWEYLKQETSEKTRIQEAATKMIHYPHSI